MVGAGHSEEESGPYKIEGRGRVARDSQSVLLSRKQASAAQGET